MKASLLRLLRVLYLIVMCSGICLWPVSEAAGDNMISLEQYRTRVHRVLERLRPDEQPLQADEESWMMEQLPGNLQVQRSDGTTMAVDRSDLLRWTREACDSPEGKKNLITYLGTLEDHLSKAHSRYSPRETGWAASQRALDRVYQEPEFRHLNGWEIPFLSEFIKKIFRWLKDLIQNVMPSMSTSHWKSVEWLAYAIVLILGGLVIYQALRWIRPFGVKRTSPSASGEVAVRSVDPDWRGWRERAQTKAREGAYREAIRCFFLSIMMEGHHRGWWFFEPEATNREHLSRLTQQPFRRDVLQSLVEQYERAWYGMSQPDRTRFEEFQSLWQRLEASTGFEGVR